MVHRLVVYLYRGVSSIFALLSHYVSFKKAVPGYCVCQSTRMQKLKSFYWTSPAFNTYSATGGKGRTSSCWLLGLHGTRMNAADKSSRVERLNGVAKSRRNRVMSLGTFAAVITLVACIHLGFWALKNPNTTAASIDGWLPSVSYNRFAEKSSGGLRVTSAFTPTHPIGRLPHRPR